MFLGTHTPRLDDKGRLFLPAKFRDQLAEGVVITRGQDHCLFVWPRADFLRITEQLRSAPFTHRGARELTRMLAAGASDEVPDKQGRVTIPAALRDYAGLRRDCAVVGAMTRLEIWDAETWDAYQAEKESVFADISEEVFPGLV